jgi:hypothetical protein
MKNKIKLTKKEMEETKIKEITTRMFNIKINIFVKC